MSDGPFDADLGVVNVGLESFADAIEAAGSPVERVEWRPPEGVDDALNRTLTDLYRAGDEIAAANREAFDRMTEATAVWTDVQTAADVIDGLSGHHLLHAGPPVTWEEMSGPQRGAVMGAMVYEGWAETPEEAAETAADEVEFSPCHEHRAIGPMAGVISPSMPVAVVENEVHGNTAYANLNESRGAVLRFGAYGDEVVEGLEWMEAELGPVLKSAVQELGGVNLTSLNARAVQMGDELHNRNVGATSLLMRTLLPGMVRSDQPKERKETVAEFIGENDIFYLNLAMAAGKVAADAAAAVERSSVLTAMTRNGTEFGIRVSGLGDEWFTAPAPQVDGLYFPEYSAEDASRDIGDSTIMETIGLGGFAMAAAPAITDFVGGTPQEAMGRTREMYEITVGENPNYTIPALEFRGTPTGIDLLQVIDTGIQPFINTGIAHREPGIGQIGAGLVRAPRTCFLDAAEAYCQRYA